MVGFVGLSAVAAIPAFLDFGKNSAGTLADLALHGPYLVPEMQSLVGGTIRMSTCRHDWRVCTDNRDWARNGDRIEPQRACLRRAEAASRLGTVAWDRSWKEPRFDIYMNGTSIRRGYVVLADHGALVRDGFGGWVNVPLHCRFDFVTREAHFVASP